MTIDKQHGSSSGPVVAPPARRLAQRSAPSPPPPATTPTPTPTNTNNTTNTPPLHDNNSQPVPETRRTQATLPDTPQQHNVPRGAPCCSAPPRRTPGRAPPAPRPPGPWWRPRTGLPGRCLPRRLPGCAPARAPARLPPGGRSPPGVTSAVGVGVHTHHTHKVKHTITEQDCVCVSGIVCIMHPDGFRA